MHDTPASAFWLPEPEVAFGLVAADQEDPSQVLTTVNDDGLPPATFCDPTATQKLGLVHETAEYLRLLPSPAGTIVHAVPSHCSITADMLDSCHS